MTVECPGAHHKGCACHEAQRDAEIASLRQELEAEREAHCWDYSPAMAEAAINGHVATIARLRACVADLERVLAGGAVTVHGTFDPPPQTVGERVAFAAGCAMCDTLRAKIDRVREACSAPRPHRDDCDRAVYGDGDCQCGAWACESMGVEIAALLGEPKP